MVNVVIPSTHSQLSDCIRVGIQAAWLQRACKNIFNYIQLSFFFFFGMRQGYRVDGICF